MVSRQKGLVMAKNKRSDTVNCAIRRSYAKLARRYFECAMEQVQHEVNACEVGRKVEPAMQKIEDYLEKAGADATRYNF